MIDRSEIPVDLFLDRGIVINNLFIVSDIHLGRTGKIERPFPTPEYNDIKERLRESLSYITKEYSGTVDTVVIAGDVFQQFDHPPDEAIKTLNEIQEIIENDYGMKLVVTPGNHDTYKFDIESIYDGYVEKEFTIGNVCIFHGHFDPDTSPEIFVIGHLHPIIEYNSSTWPCFLYGRNVFNESDVIILPAFTNTVNGVSIESYYNSISLSAPIITDGCEIGNYYPIVRLDKGEELIFPQVKNIYN